MITPGRLWWLLQRDIRRGWKGSYHFYRTLPRILNWRWPFWNERMRDVPVHILTGAGDWLLGAWMLASWFYFSKEAWPIVVHDDGTLPDEARQAFCRMFPEVRFIDRSEADAAMAGVLADFPLCADYRAHYPLGLKIFDAPHFCETDHFFLFDSDLLFFKKPREVLAWAEAKPAECWFNEDAEEGALVSAKEAREELAVELWPKVNSGLCLIHKSAVDLCFCEKALAATAILRGHFWRIEQTLFALCASRLGAGGLLPPCYEVSLGKDSQPGAISRHYVGKVRDRFYAEGLSRLAPKLIGRAAR